MKPFSAAVRRQSSAPAFLFCIALSLAVTASPLPAGTTDPASPDNPLYSGYVFRKTPQTITLGTQPLYIPLGVISEILKHDRVLQKSLAERDADLNVLPFLKGPDINAFLKKADIDISMASDMPTITLAATSDIVIAGIVKLGTSSIITSKKYNRITDLRGKRIGVPEETSAHLALLVALEAAGMRENDVKTVFLDSSELDDALSAGRVDAFSAFEPIPEQALAEKSDLHVIHRFISSSYLFFSRAFVENRSEDARQILAAYIRGLRWMNSEEANLFRAAAWAKANAEFFIKKPFSTVEQLESITQESILKYADAPLVPQSDMKGRGTIAHLFEFLKKKEKIPGNVAWSQVSRSLNRSMLREVLAAPVQYQLDTFDYSLDPAPP